MKKNITNHKHTALAVTMAAVLALVGCGSVAATETVILETAAQTVEVMETVVSLEESTEVIVPETETVKLETNAAKAKYEVKGLTEIASEPSPKAETIGYTYTDMNVIMYAKSAVNVRSLPSTDGTRLGALGANQMVAVTGQCNETGWYRIQYGDGEAYVSNKYLVGEATEQVVAQTEQTEETPVYSGDTQMIMLTAAMEQFGMNILVYGDGTILDSTTWQQLGTVDENGQVTVGAGTSTLVNPATIPDGFNRAAAEEVWAYMNAERVAAGLNEIAWDEEIYNFACQRAQAIVTNYSHSGSGQYAENIAKSYNDDGYTIHMLWHNSTGHYNNYMKNSRTAGACAIYVYNGIAYAVENFDTDATIMAKKEANSPTWTASNGITLIIDEGGDVSCNKIGDDVTTAILEYYASH